MPSQDQGPDLVKTASLTLPPEALGTPEVAEKSQILEGGRQVENLLERESGISYQRLVTIMIGLCLTIFLTALDQVCVHLRTSPKLTYVDNCVYSGADDGC